MKKFYFLAALVAGTALTSCTSEDDLALSPPEVNNVEDGYAPIVFSSVKNNITRADVTGADAAKLLNYKFVVSGYKGSKSEWQTVDDDQQDPPIKKSNIVFDNYLVTYAENTANTTESNEKNWEYVDVDNSPIDHAKTNGITKQTIKYWDYSQAQYDFIAWATGIKKVTDEQTNEVSEVAIVPIYSGIPSTNEVLVSAITPETATGDATAANSTVVAYTFTGKAVDLSNCYVADLVTVKKKDGNYGQPVTIRFRQLGTKVRIALYETVPGYSVKEVKFYSAEASNDASAAEAKLFTTTENQIFTEGRYTVYFPTVDSDVADNNQAHIKFDPVVPVDNGGQQEEQTKPQATTVSWGGLNYTIRENGEHSEDAIYLGRTSNTASFAGSPDENYYQVFLPNSTGTNLNLRVNYTLEAIDGCGEIIEVKGATAQVPSIYTTWKPGYAYTYLFKISDKTNGHTGVYDPEHPDDTSINSDPAGLFPITFDAVVVNAEEDATQETITLVSTPSITTYQNGSNVVNKNEYSVLTPSGKITGEIYVTVNDADAATHVAANPQPAAGASVANYYIKDGNNFIPCAADATAPATNAPTYYYKNVPALPNGTLADLDGKVNLYTVAEGTTEAQVIDALQLQNNDDKANDITILGRNKVALTEATSPNHLQLTSEVTYGADGNTIEVETNQAAKFVPEANTTYAFVYTKTAASGTEEEVYEPVSFSNTAVTKKYRIKTNAIAQAGDVVKNVIYYAPDVNNDNKLTKKTVFIGQDVSNLFTRSGEAPYTYTAATDYASSSKDYYYKLGDTYYDATEVAYAAFNNTGDDQLYVKTGDNYVPKVETETEPVDGTAYYRRSGGTGTPADPYVYTYCVILPEQTNTNWVTVNENETQKVLVANNEAEIIGMTYFDMYTKNNGVYYTKVIKIDE